MANQGIQSYPQAQINFMPKVPPLKKVKDKTKINIRYAVIAPYAFIHIYWDPELFEVVYDIEEPILDETEQAYREQIIEAMRNMINFDTIIEKDTQSLLNYIDILLYNI